MFDFGGSVTRRSSSNNPHFTAKVLREADDSSAAVGAPVTASMLSPDQAAVFDKVMEFVKDDNYGTGSYLTLGGLAGTGKTTLVAVLANELDASKIAFAAFTGKAASVLSRKLRESGVKNPQCSTLHRLMYKPRIGKDGQIAGWDLQDSLPGIKLIVVDEASMLSTELWLDLQTFNIPILAVGDHGQLPPVGKKEDNPGLMNDPMLRLEQIHRQAIGNPIIALAHHVRQGGNIRGAQIDRYDTRVQFAKSAIDAVAMMGGIAAIREKPLDVGVICGRNATRMRINEAVRMQLGYSGPVPDPGDVVIALRNFPPIFNGLRGIFRGPTGTPAYDANEYGAFKGAIELPDENLLIEGDINYHQFGREKTFGIPKEIPGEPTSFRQAGTLWDFGYAMTCHKAQGSQFEQCVVLSGDTFGDSDTRKRWLYTAVSRASEKLILI
jgi:exodeoxyribonuclease-5